MEKYLMVDAPNTPKFDAMLTLASRVKGLDESAVAASLDLLQTASALRLALHERFFRDHISEGRFTVLTLLLTAPDWSMTPSQLADAAGVKRATMTGLLDGLEKSSYVERRAFRDDRRKITVHLTREGREYLLDLAPAYFAQLEAIGSHLPDPKRKGLASLLAKLRDGAA